MTNPDELPSEGDCGGQSGPPSKSSSKGSLGDARTPVLASPDTGPYGGGGFTPAAGGDGANGVTKATSEGTEAASEGMEAASEAGKTTSGVTKATACDGAFPEPDSCLPEFGFKVNLDHKFPKKWEPNNSVRLSQVWPLLPLGLRYFKFWAVTKLRGKKPFLDQLLPETTKQMYGVPLGGIGSGTIGRGFRGEFCRFQITPGMYDYNTAFGSHFLVTVREVDGAVVFQKVLAPAGRGKSKGLSAWDFDNSDVTGRYCGLYPRSWTVYDIKRCGIRLVVRQISPVMPDEYKDSCLPVGVFVWRVFNYGGSAKKVTITLSCRNGTGGPEGKKGECHGETLSSDASGVHCALLHHRLRGTDVTYCVAAAETEGVRVSACKGFDPTESGVEVWDSLRSTGQLHEASAGAPSMDQHHRVGELCVAACAEVTVPSGGDAAELTLSLSWDTHTVSFTSRQHHHRRRYHRWFSGPHAASSIAQHALERYTQWEQAIEAWQDTVLQEPDVPDWFKSALFNQLYYVADGGTVWIDVSEEEAKGFPKEDPRHEYGRFAYLESHEYRMYNTYDVHFYASWALVMLWPQLQRVLQYDIAMYTLASDPAPRSSLFTGKAAVRSVANTVPHDVGDPEDEPFAHVNGYLIHDVSSWKDLNLKFVLQVYRDYRLFGGDMHYLRAMWPVCLVVMTSSLAMDKDGDGLIENDGIPDQTYDSWTMHGPSAYCTSLWLASLCVMEEMAGLMEQPEEQQRYAALLAKAKDACVAKLWNGKYFNFDSCTDPHHKSIMSDQLVGHWYLALSGVDKEVFGEERVELALKTMYDNNVLKFCGGRMGAVNGMMPDGKIDCFTIQSEEMWPGVAYGLAATMIKEGMIKEGFKTAEGIYRMTHEELGLAYDTPEALMAHERYRAIGYMRPLSVWSMWRAWGLRKQQDK